MSPETKILLAVLGGLFLLLLIGVAILLIRALRFKPAPAVAEEVEPVFVNSEKATHDLAEMIKCRTISDRDRSREDNEEFERFKALLPELFPNV